jgi:SAM-dependent methyltransferase
MFTRSVVPGTTSRLTGVDHHETFGRHILKRVCREFWPDTSIGPSIGQVLDLGCGAGDDLSIVLGQHPRAEAHGVDYGDWNAAALKQRGIQPVRVNIEQQALPFATGSFDLVIANQVMEHCKEVFWINHEVFRALKVGGIFYLGVPNVLSLHNRILALCGQHPTQYKSYSAHVRPFSIPDTKAFYRFVAPSVCRVRSVYGSQFYPFPGPIARLMADTFPGMAFSVFFAIEKIAEYQDEFINWPQSHALETNFRVRPS